MAHTTRTSSELVQLLNALGVTVATTDRQKLATLSPSFLESRLQTYLEHTQPTIPTSATKKIALSGSEPGDIARVNLRPHFSSPIHGGGGGHGHGHGHSHGGEPCDGSHGAPKPAHSHSHGGGNAHGHSHGGEPCDGSHGAPKPQPPPAASHSHSHGGEPCDGSHGAPKPESSAHSHSHGAPRVEEIHSDEEEEDDHGHGHGHTHGGEPCAGHDDEEEEEDEDEDEEYGEEDSPQTNQVLQATKHYLSILIEGIQTVWNKPPMFPGAPKSNIWILSEPSANGKPHPTNPGYDLILTIAGADVIPSATSAPIPVILLHYALHTPAAQKSLFGDSMRLSLPREILHLLYILLTANSAKTPSFKAPPNVQLGPASTGFKPSFLLPISDELPSEDIVGKLDITKATLEKMGNCDACGGLGPVLKCARCKNRGYCSSACQKKDWKAHKEGCKV